MTLSGEWRTYVYWSAVCVLCLSLIIYYDFLIDRMKIWRKARFLFSDEIVEVVTKGRHIGTVKDLEGFVCCVKEWNSCCKSSCFSLFSSQRISHQAFPRVLACLDLLENEQRPATWYNAASADHFNEQRAISTKIVFRVETFARKKKKNKNKEKASRPGSQQLQEVAWFGLLLWFALRMRSRSTLELWQ